MDAMNLLLCLLPVIAQAQITVNIQASKKTTDGSLQVTGASQAIVTNEDQNFFHLTEETLKNAVFNLTGREPTDVFLNGPTPWNDLYKTYGWEPVKTIIIPHRIKLLDVKTSKVVLNVRKIANEETVPKKEEVLLTAKVENKVSCTWQQNASFAAEIGYNINMFSLGSNLKLNSTFGQNVKGNKIVMMNSPSVEFVLQPKQHATVVFKATNVKVLVEVEYWVMLSGYVATNNEVMLNNHHFWAYNVNRIMKTVSLPNLRKTKEIIAVEFVTDGGIVVG